MVLSRKRHVPVHAKEEIFDLIKMHRYSEVIERCTKNPREAKILRCRSECFPRAYHRACLQSDCHTDGAIFEREDAPRTALHAACADGQVPVGVVRALLQAWPESAAVRLKDSGRTPLHIAACVAENSGVIAALVQSNQSLLNARDHYGRTPLAHLCHAYGVTLRQALEEDSTQNLKLIKEIREDATDKRRRDQLSLFWTNASVLVKETARLVMKKERALKGKDQSCDTSKDFRMVHACLSIGKRCPIDLLSLSIRIHPEQLGQSDENDHGNTPLHVVCQRGDIRFLPLILEAFPVSSRVENECGKLPLHLLASRTSRYAESMDFNVMNTVHKLISAYPDALLSQENGTGLVPFMLAATAAKSSTRAKQENHDEKDWVSASEVSIIFDLLRSCPAASSLRF